MSVDGVDLPPAGRVGHDVPDDREGVFRRDLVVDLDGTPVRALRLPRRNYGTMPAWHPGAGGAAFVFVDEIIIE